VFVFCDVDETLISCKSLLDFAAFMRRPPAATASLAAPETPSRDAANERYYAALAGRSARQLAVEALAWYTWRSRDPRFFIASTRAELARHRAAGAHLVLVSGSMPALLAPIADAVGAHHVLCSCPEVQAGRLTGRLRGKPVIGEGKREAVRRLLAQYPDARPEDCVGYGDHVSDAPMLEEVGRPVIVGGDPGLVRLVPHARVLARA
jgi:HAD superfamily hydrolase (TIGR01490 family)